MTRPFLFLLLLVLAAPSAHAQGVRPLIKPPSQVVLLQADALTDTVFAALKEGRTQDVAEFLNRHVGYAVSQSEQVKSISQVRSQLDVVLLPPPDGPFGQMDGYDLLEESYLPGSDRFFRRTYLTYHEGGPLTWEFRYYVRPSGRVVLNAYQFDPKNPFEYLSTSDMLLNRWYDRGGS